MTSHESRSPAVIDPSPGVSLQSPTPNHVAALLVVGLLIRLALIARYPIVFGDDTIARLANAEHIVLSHQLPLLQLAIHYLYALRPDPLPVRLFVSVVGSIGAVGMYLVATRLLSRAEAWYAGVLFTCNPFILPLSTVPYQEILMLAGLLGAFYGAFTGRWYVASACLGIACLTRYESWLACPVLTGAYVSRRGVSVACIAEGLILFGWAPFAWIAYNRGLAPAGSYAVEARVTPERLLRWTYLVQVSAANMALPALPLVGLGIWQFARRRLWLSFPYQVLLAFLGLFLIAILFSAQGTEAQPERFVTPRESHIPLVGATLLAALGLTAVPRYRSAVVALCAFAGLWKTDRTMARETSLPGVALSFAAGRYLDREVGSAERVVVLAEPIDDVELYLDKLERVRGPRARAAGIAILRHLETTPPNYQRILVHSHLGKARLRSYASLIARTQGREEVVVTQPPFARRPEWMLKWSDFRPTNANELELAETVARFEPRKVFRQGDVQLAVYRIDSPD